MGKRIATALWVAGVIALALSVGLGSRAAQEHLGARRAWLAQSDDPTRADYDAARSDDLYELSNAALDGVETWATVGGAGLLALVLGLLLRPRAPARRPWLRGALAIAAGIVLHTAVVVLSVRFDHELLGPFVGTVGNMVAPSLGAAGGAVVWLTRRGARSTTAGSGGAPPPGPRS